MCSNAEHQAIDSIIDKGPIEAGAMDLKVVQGNYKLTSLVIWSCVARGCGVSVWSDPFGLANSN